MITLAQKLSHSRVFSAIMTAVLCFGLMPGLMAPVQAQAADKDGFISETAVAIRGAELNEIYTQNPNVADGVPYIHNVWHINGHRAYCIQIGRAVHDDITYTSSEMTESTAVQIGLYKKFLSDNKEKYNISDSAEQSYYQFMIWSVVDPVDYKNVTAVVPADGGTYEKDKRFYKIFAEAKEFVEANKDLYGGEGIVWRTDTYQNMCSDVDIWLKTGTLKIQKYSANTSITNGNDCYSYKGAEFKVYDKDGKCVQTLTTDSKGMTAESDPLLIGDYTIKETKAPEGYALAADKKITIGKKTVGEVQIIEIADQPMCDPVRIAIEKMDSEKEYRADGNQPQGGAKLSGAEFTIEYYDGQYSTKAAAAASGEPTRTWVYASDDNGQVNVQAQNPLAKSSDGKHASDATYKNSIGITTFPLGTYVITETKAPEGYTMPSTTTFVRNVTEETGTAENVNTYGEPTEQTAFKEQVFRGDISFSKKNGADGTKFAGIPFRLTNVASGESHIIVTDANGYASTKTADNKHSTNTNSNDSVSNGAYDAGAGVWFGKAEYSSAVPVNDSRGALPYGEYRLEELSCDANSGHELISDTFTVYKNNQNIEFGTLDDQETVPPSISTTARDGADGDKIVSCQPDATIIDTVAYENLEKGIEYKLTATLYKKNVGEDGTSTAEAVTDNDGNPVTGSVEFTAEDNAAGTVDVPLTFNCAGIDENTKLVVFESLAKADSDREIASHADIDDEGQTVTTEKPGVKTTAKDGADGDKAIERDRAENAAIVDTVAYTGLIPGKEYTVSGTLMVKKASGEGEETASSELLDKDGKPVTASQTFTPENSEGTVDIAFAFDASLVGGGTQIVAFESLSRDGIEIASHADIDDEGQTVEVVEPTIHTTAADKADGDKSIAADPECAITDTVAYENLVPGNGYSITGILIDKTTQLPLIEGDNADKVSKEDLESFWNGLQAALGVDDSAALPHEIDSKAVETVLSQNKALAGYLVMKTAEFAPEASSGSTDMEFTFDGLGREDSDTVVFEYLYTNGKLVADHADIDDEGQTVTIVPPGISTTATDKTDGDHELLPSRNAAIVDTVAYTGLIPGKEYTVSGTLMDKETGKKLMVDDAAVTAEKSFTPNKADGEVKLEFTFDATALQGKEIVVFETLYKDGVEIASHADINDEDQTVKVSGEPTAAADDSSAAPGGTSYDKTGVDLGALIAILIAAILAAGGFGYNAYRNRKLAATETAAGADGGENDRQPR